ncbi:MAG TPA: hypothetical protein VIL97_10445 [Thermoanaerobaculia bacterium]
MRTFSLTLLLVAAMLVGCRETSGSGDNPRVVLPPGDVVAGEQAYRDLRCHACHPLYGGDMPAPIADPLVPVYLGGNAIPPPSREALLSAISDPSHRLAPGWPEDLTASGTGSRMGDYTEVMTVRQLVDVTAFLQSRYGREAEANVRKSLERRKTPGAEPAR